MKLFKKDFPNIIDKKVLEPVRNFMDEFTKKSRIERQEDIKKAYKEIGEKVDEIRENLRNEITPIPTAQKIGGKSVTEEIVDGRELASDVDTNVYPKTTNEPPIPPKVNQSNNSSPNAGKYMVVDGAMCTCDLGATPMVRIPITTHSKYYANEKLVATQKDGALVTPFFGKCNAKSPAVPCTYSKADWVFTPAENHPKAGKFLVLIDGATITCKQGGIISIVNHGQQTTVSSKDIGGFSVDTASAVSCLMELPTEDIPNTKIKAQGTAVKVTLIKCEAHDASKNKAINERIGEKLTFEATAPGNPRLVNWGVKKDSDKEWTVFAQYGDSIELHFNELGKYVVLARGQSGIATNSKIDGKDNKCYFNVDILDKNEIKSFSLVTIKPIKDEMVEVKLAYALPLNSEEEDKLYIRVEDQNGGDISIVENANLTINKKEGLIKFIPQNIGNYTVTAYLEENNKQEVSFFVNSNAVSKINFEQTPGEIFRKDSELNIPITLKGTYTDSSKIYWRVNGQSLSDNGPSLKLILSKSIKYKIEAIYWDIDGVVKWGKNEADISITASENKVSTILPQQGLYRTDEKGVYRTYVGKEGVKFEADLLINKAPKYPLTKSVDEKIKWIRKNDITGIETPIKEKNASSQNSETYCSAYKKESDKLETGGEILCFNTSEEGTFILKSYCSISSEAAPTVKIKIEKSKILRWKFTDVSDKESYIKYIGWKQPFKIAIQVEGWENEHGKLNAYYDPRKGPGKSVKLFSDLAVSFDEEGKCGVVINKSHTHFNTFWETLSSQKYKEEYPVYFTIKDAPICKDQDERVFSSSDRTKEIIPDMQGHNGKEQRLYAYINDKTQYTPYFATAEGVHLKKIVKYGDPVHVVIHRAKGKESDCKSTDKYTLTIYENKEDKDVVVESFVDVTFGEVGKIDIALDTASDKYGEKSHAEEKVHQPRFFYFVLQGTNSEDKVIYPNGFDPSKTNDEDLAGASYEKGKEETKGATDKVNKNYFYQLKLAKSTTLNKSLENNAMVIIGEPIEREENRNAKRCFCKEQGLKSISCSGRGCEISKKDYEAEATILGVEAAILYAIAKQESKNKGFNSEGKAIILFERHYMYRQTIKNGRKTKEEVDILVQEQPTIINSSGTPGGEYGTSDRQYAKLEEAKKINYDSAVESCSWGQFQVMGAHYHLIYATPEDLEEAMNTCAFQQFRYFIAYLNTTVGMKKALQNKKWEKVASLYNGQNWSDKNPNYASNIEKYYNEFNK